jgi:hypothetical protein
MQRTLRCGLLFVFFLFLVAGAMASDLPRVEAREYTGAAPEPSHVRWDVGAN